MKKTDALPILKKLAVKALSAVTLSASVITILILVYRFGFKMDSQLSHTLTGANRVLLIVLWFAITTRMAVKGFREHRIAFRSVRFVVYVLFTLVSLLSMLVSAGVIGNVGFVDIATGNVVIIILSLVVSFAEISAAITSMLSSHANPAAILASSFGIIILIGSLLLQLPNCLNTDISYIDSLFVSTSAVCVTGLTPIDISSTFTQYGQFVIMMLIQIGGLGIMTITSFFGLFFAGRGSLSNQIMVKELLSGESLNGLLRAMMKIIGITLAVEAIGAIFIYSSIQGTQGVDSPIFFSIFHSVSAFCNAGFSTLSGGLYDPVVRNMSGLVTTIGLLVIFGGIGFPIFTNFLSILWHRVKNLLRRIWGIRRVHKSHLLSLNSYIVLLTTAVLLGVSWALILVFEWHHTLAGMPVFDKLTQGFFMAVTPRTAGFNNVDLMKMAPASILLTMALMWIGGAPQSTAGGIKVTTFFLMFKNIFNIRGKSNGIKVHKRTIPVGSLQRVFSIVTISISFIFGGVLLLSIFEPEIELDRLIFEVISAIGTVGLSLNLTPILSPESKIVVIGLMFVGRVGVITTLVMFMRRPRASSAYTYPEEEILIN